MDINDLSQRELQKESARALEAMRKEGVNIAKFNRLVDHDSREWYRVVLREYQNEYGGLPSEIGPGKDIKTASDV